MPFDFNAWIRDGKTTGKYDFHPDYEKLPEVLRHAYSAEEYAWLSDDQRNYLIESECYPEPDGEDDY